MAKTEYKPDCGYAWVVVAACFSINFIMAGLARAAGVLYIAIIDTYAVSREVASSPFSLRFCVRNMSGPLVGALGQRFGIRPVVLIGGIVSGVGGIVCALAPNVTWITIAWGGVHGLGYGMCNLIHVIILNNYFHKYKGLALGIALTGDCVGSFLLPILLEFLIIVYDLKGTFLILAGISLNVVPAAMLLTCPPWQDQSSYLPNSQDIGKLSDGDKMCYNNGIDNIAFVNDSEQRTVKCNNTVMKHNNSNISLEVKDKISRLSIPFCSESNELQNIIRQPRIMSIPDICFKDMPRNGNRNYMPSTQSELSNTNEASSPRLLAKTSKTSGTNPNFPVYEINRKNSQISILSCPPTRYPEKPTVEILCKSVIRDNLLYPVQYIVPDNIDINKGEQLDTEDILSKQCHDTIINNHGDHFHNVTNNTKDKYDLSSNNHSTTIFATECKDNSLYTYNEYSGDLITTKVREPNAFRQFIKTNIKPIFFLISVTMALYVFMFIAVFTIIIDYASDNDIPTEYATYLLLAFSVTDMFGRLGFGVVLDKRWIKLPHYAGMTTALIGLFIFVMPFNTNFTFWMTSFSLCGFIQGGSAIMYPILIEQYMEKNEESVAMGCMNFYGGLLMLPIPFMIGYFRDTIGSYDGLLWTTGGLCIFAGCLWVLEPCLIRLQSKTDKENGTSAIRRSTLY